MPSNLQVLYLAPSDAVPIAANLPSGGCKDPFGLIQTNLGAGLGFPASLPEPFPTATEAAYWLVWIPQGTTLATGLTANLILVDDLANPSPAGKVTFDITFALVVSGTSQLNDALFNSGTAVSAQTTMPATSGVVKTQAIAVAAANFSGTVAVNSYALIRVRRKPPTTGTLDTHTGRVVLLGVDIIDT